MCRKQMGNRAILIYGSSAAMYHLYTEHIHLFRRIEYMDTVCTELHVSSNMRISYVLYIFIIIIAFQFEIN